MFNKAGSETMKVLKISERLLALLMSLTTLKILNDLTIITALLILTPAA